MTDDYTDIANSKAPRDRSPGFPFISLETAVQRLSQIEQKFGRHPTPVNKVGLAWEMKENSSQADQTVAAMKYFGLVEYEGSGLSRRVFITEDGRNYLRAQQEGIKKDLLKKFALNPREITKFWEKWGKDRPHDSVCLDELILNHKYNENAAPKFLKIYDETIEFSGLTEFDKSGEPVLFTDNAEVSHKNSLNQKDSANNRFTFNQPLKSTTELMAGERILQDGILSQNTKYRIIVSGKISTKELDRLIKKLQMDREILSEEEQETDTLS